jgi:uncharacterized protein with von Willebrand factor type A (vWA) domain
MTGAPSGRFADSGLAGEKKSREKTAREIYAVLRSGPEAQPGQETGPEAKTAILSPAPAGGPALSKRPSLFLSSVPAPSLSPSPALSPFADAGNFSHAIDGILSNQTLRELGGADPGLAEELTREVLGFINSTAGKMALAENPFEKEERLFQEFEQTSRDELAEVWEDISGCIAALYEPEILDPEFYYTEFHEEHSGFESVKEHFLEKWRKLLFQKRTNWELEFIDRERRLFCALLYAQIEQFKEIQEILEPLTSELGRLWDMSRGRWQKINLDILRTYSKLFKKDSSLRALAEMLGRMRRAETEYEEELFAETVIQPEWETSHAGKADLAGIHESGDLSSLLPSQTALFADEETAPVFYMKFAEKKLQTFEYRSMERILKEEQKMKKRRKQKKEGRGPFIICVDTSGSMQGTPETVAKTLCFAILKMALHEQRQCYLISFSQKVQTLNLTNLKNDPESRGLEKITDFFSMSFYGGTDPVPPMREALAMLDTRDFHKADIVMVSDFVMPPPDTQTRHLILAARENHTRFHSLVIGRSGNKNAIADFDNNWIYDVENPDKVLTLVSDLSAIS